MPTLILVFQVYGFGEHAISTRAKGSWGDNILDEVPRDLHDPGVEVMRRLCHVLPEIQGTHLRSVHAGDNLMVIQLQWTPLVVPHAVSEHDARPMDPNMFWSVSSSMH